MKFFFTVKLPARNGGHAQSVVGEHSAGSIQELADILNANEFIVVTEEFETPAGAVRASETILARRAIGKVRAYRESRRQEREPG